MISAAADRSNDYDEWRLLASSAVEAAAEGDDAGYGHAAPGGHDGPTGTNLGAPAFACRVFLDARLIHQAVL
jgi:hypothetical protein